MCAKLLQSCPTPCDPMDYSLPGSSIHGILQAQSTGVDCHALLQGIFLTQGSNPCFLHWQVGSLLLALPEKPFSSPSLSHFPFKHFSLIFL